MDKITERPNSDFESRGLRGVINGKAAALIEFSDMLTLSQSEGKAYAQPWPLRDYAPE